MRESRKSSPINASTSNWRRFNFGKRSVPPATNIAFAPSSPAMSAASRADFGRRYLNRGRRSIKFLGWRLYLYAVRIRDVWEPRRSEPPRLSLLLPAQRLDHLLRRHRRLIDPHAQRVEHRRVHRRDHRQQRPLPGFFGPIQTFGVVRLDDERLHLGGVEEGGRLVLEHRRPLVQALAKLLLLHQRLAQAHVDASLDLPLDQERVDGTADVMRDPDLVDLDEPSARIDVQVDHARRV